MQRTRVLVADDNGIYRAQLGRFVSSQPDMEVVGFASDGGEAVSLASLLRPDLVLMDLCMPGLDGFDATQTLASSHAEVKVIALTAHRAPDTEQRSLEAGAAAFLRKSDVDSRLLDVIRGLAAGSHPDGSDRPPRPTYPGPPPS
jgi:NarL family two-component system response regulator LiaR